VPHARGQQAPPAAHYRAFRAGIEVHGARGLEHVRDPVLAAREPIGRGEQPGAGIAARIEHRRQRTATPPVRDHRGDARGGGLARSRELGRHAARADAVARRTGH
jgi:hypothetical protein